MIAVGANHSIGFFVEHFLHRRTRTDLVPHARFRLQIESNLICGFEGSFRRTPRMEAHVVEAPLLACLEQHSPRLDVSGRITGQRKVAAMLRAAKIDRMTVENELIAFRMK